MNKWDQFVWTPLHHAAYAGHVEMIELLLEAGAAVDAPALNGGTPLMRAIQSSRPSCVDVLLKAGADVNAVTKTGVSLHLGGGGWEFNQIHKARALEVAYPVLNICFPYPLRSNLHGHRQKFCRPQGH